MMKAMGAQASHMSRLNAAACLNARGVAHLQSAVPGGGGQGPPRGGGGGGGRILLPSTMVCKELTG